LVSASLGMLSPSSSTWASFESSTTTSVASASVTIKRFIGNLLVLWKRPRLNWIVCCQYEAGKPDRKWVTAQFAARRRSCHNVCRYAIRSSSSCCVIASPTGGIMLRPPTIVCSTNRSLAGSPLGRNCFPKRCFRLGPLLPDDEYALWQAAQSRSNARRPRDCFAFRPSSASDFGAGSPQPTARINKMPHTKIAARRRKLESYSTLPLAYTPNRVSEFRRVLVLVPIVPESATRATVGSFLLS
jgi:hypothetical protein